MQNAKNTIWLLVTLFTASAIANTIPLAQAQFGDADGDGFVDGLETAVGSDPTNAASVPESFLVSLIAPPFVQCFDGVDNDLDGLIDGADAGCVNSDGDFAEDPLETLFGSDPTSSSSTPEDFFLDAFIATLIPFPGFCTDGFDNDADGLVDFFDPGCSPDTDGDGFPDGVELAFGSDPNDPASTPEHFSVAGSCSDGVDNDLDGIVDLAEIDCQTTNVVAVWQHKDDGALTSPDYDIYYSVLDSTFTWSAIGGPVPEAGPIAVLGGDDKNPHVSTGGDGPDSDTTGDTIAVWQHQHDDGSWDIKSAQFTGTGATGWTDPIPVTTTTGNEFDPNVAVDTNGAAVAVWIQDIGGSRDVRYSVLSGGSWSSPGIVGTLGGNPSLPEVTITSVASVGAPMAHRAVATWADVPPGAGGLHKQIYSIFDGVSWSAPVDIEVVIAGAGGFSIADVGFATYSGGEPDPYGAFGRNGITSDASFSYIVWSGGPEELGFGSPGVVGAVLDVSANSVTPMLNPFGDRLVGIGGCQEPDDAIIGAAEFVNVFSFAGFIEDSRKTPAGFTLEQVAYNSPSDDRRPSDAAFASTIVISANWHSSSAGGSPAAFPGEIAWSSGTLTTPVGFDDGISWTISDEIVPGGLLGDDRFPELSSAFAIEVIVPDEVEISKFFTDSDLNPLPIDETGNPSVAVLIANGVVRSTNPGQVIVWVRVANTGSTPRFSLTIDETLPTDWTVHPNWDPARGAIHVYFEFTDGSRVEITDPTTITTTTGNPETVELSIPDISATAAAKPLETGESILLAVKIDYALQGMSLAPEDVPHDFIDTASTEVFAEPNYMGEVDTDSVTAGFHANAKVVGDVDGDMDIDFADAFLLVSAYNSQRGDPAWDARADFDFNGVIDADDATQLALYYK